MAITSAAVETLTAEVRVLMAGSRQITLSVFRQLDWADPDDCEPMGRVNDERSRTDVWDRLLVGRHVLTGALVRAKFISQPMTDYSRREFNRLIANRGHLLEHERNQLQWLEEWSRQEARWLNVQASYEALPLIVLAGLK